MSALDPLKRVHVVVGVPSLYDMWHEKFCMSLINMVRHFQEVPLGSFRKQSIQVGSMRGSDLRNVRLDIVKRAQSVDASHLLFADADQTYPKDTLHRLIKHDVDVVACNIATKQIPSQPTARYFNEKKLATGERVYNDPKKGLEKVWRVGTGVMLIKMKIFEKTGLNVFSGPWQEEYQKYQGEDWSLVEACEKVGIPVYIDHALSEEVRHWGQFGYDHDVVGDVVKLEDGHSFPLPERMANG